MGLLRLYMRHSQSKLAEEFLELSRKMTHKAESFLSYSAVESKIVVSLFCNMAAGAAVVRDVYAATMFQYTCR